MTLNLCSRCGHQSQGHRGAQHTSSLQSDIPTESQADIGAHLRLKCGLVHRSLGVNFGGPTSVWLSRPGWGDRDEVALGSASTACSSRSCIPPASSHRSPCFRLLCPLQQPSGPAATGGRPCSSCANPAGPGQTEGQCKAAEVRRRATLCLGPTSGAFATACWVETKCHKTGKDQKDVLTQHSR